VFSTAVEFAVLGPVEAREDGRQIPLGGPKQRALLAILALNANAPVSRDALIEGLWGEQPPASAAHMLDDCISRLRKALGSSRVIRQPPGYLLAVETDGLDLARFESLVEDGRKALAAGSYKLAASKLRAALDLWRGPALADLLYEPFASAESGRLEERRLAAVEDRIDADLALGRGGELIVELERLVREHPLRERLVAQLMLALYHAGRQTAALETFRSVRRRFAGELGLEPGPELQRLERQILEHAPELEGKRKQHFDPPRRFTIGRSKLVLLIVAVATPLAVGIAVLVAGGSAPKAKHSLIGANLLIRLSGHSGSVQRTITLASAPTAIARAPSSLWLSDVSRNEVLRANSESGVVVDRIPIAAQPGAIVVGGRAVWVAETGVPSLKRIDLATDDVTQTIPLPGPPAGMTYRDGSLWVSDPQDLALLRIDAGSGDITAAVTLPVQPSAVATGGGAVWVASFDAGTVTKVDPRSATVIATIHVGQGPAALQYAARSLWVANELDGTVSRIDPSAMTLTNTTPTGTSPSSLAFAGGVLWVANEFSGSVSRIDPNQSATATTVDVGGDPTTLVAAGGDVWVGTKPRVEHHGGTLVLLDTRRFFSIDPQVDDEAPPAQFLGLVNDGLVAYDHRPGPDGLHLVPDLALRIPTPGDGGRSYVFQLRPGVRYSTGRIVRASDFARAMTRLFLVQSPAAPSFANLIGGTRCARQPRHCSLSGGVVANDAERTVSFQLRAPDPDFLLKLATGFVVPIPPRTPMHDVGDHPIPGTGTYEWAHVGDREMRLVRNPRFREWSHAAQPDGNPDQIVWHFGQTPDQEANAVADGSADWTSDTPSNLAELARTDRGAVHSDPIPTDYFFQLNTHRPPFNDVRVRRALNYAVDRKAVARMLGGPIANKPLCQLIPPGLPGYRPYCPYTLNPSPTGAWSAPDFARARALIAASHTSGDQITITDVTDGKTPEPAVRYLTDLLRRLGFRARYRLIASAAAGRAPPSFHWDIQLQPITWGPNYPSPMDIFGVFVACSGSFSWHQFCNHNLDDEMQRAEAMRTNNPARSAALWARIDREAVARAIWLPLLYQHVINIVSTRVRNYEFSPVYLFMPDQVWLR
jgi:ABC-type transport system substrate-binding protein/DNA-binding SARP family transcriptional activator